jgi:hypothetical protein
MSVETLFGICNAVAVVGWILLLVAPRNRSVMTLSGTALPLLFAVVYLQLLIYSWSSTQGGFGSLREVAQLFENPWALLAGWVHYLAFDLFVGAWETRDALARGVSRVALAPCLLLTFLFGPIGLLCYFLVRQFAGSRSVVTVQ